MITINNLPVTSIKFPAGEMNPRLPKGLKAGPMDVVARLQSSDDILELLLVKDALYRQYGTRINLTIPYFPYSRQDRVCSTGEALSVEVMLNLIQIKCTTYDIHNPDILRADMYVNNITLLDIAKRFNVLKDSNTILVAPDVGATEKVKELAEYYNLDWIQGKKTRDPSTGKLTGFSCCQQGIDCSNKHLLIVDDICDGGGTFLGLAKILKSYNPKTLSLYVTHGIFSKGLDDLSQCFDKIYTTDTFKSGCTSSNLNTFQIVGD